MSVKPNNVKRKALAVMFPATAAELPGRPQVPLQRLCGGSFLSQREGLHGILSCCCLGERETALPIPPLQEPKSFLQGSRLHWSDPWGLAQDGVVLTQHVRMHRNTQGAERLRSPLPICLHWNTCGSRWQPSLTALPGQHGGRPLCEFPSQVLRGEAALLSPSPHCVTRLPRPLLPVSTPERALAAGTRVCCEGFRRACVVL